MPFRAFGCCVAPCLSAALFLGAQPARAQGGKEFLEWLKEYSPTGYFIITDGEARMKEPGWHKRWTGDLTLPLPGVAVHEGCHMRDGEVGGGMGTESYYVGNMRDYRLKPDFDPFNSKEMMPDIPASMENFQTDVYISNKENTNAYSQEGGLAGIFGEWNAYVTGLRSGVEMSACFKANFNSGSQWNSLAGDMTSSIMSAPEFRYFSLRYILWAQKKYPAIYTRITTGKEWRECYTLLAKWEEQTSNEWIEVLKAKGMDTKTQYGFDWYWKFRNELQKAEYTELEKIMLIPSVRIVAFRPRASLAGPGVGSARFDLQGRLVAGRLSAGAYLRRDPRAPALFAGGAR